MWLVGTGKQGTQLVQNVFLYSIRVGMLGDDSVYAHCSEEFEVLPASDRRHIIERHRLVIGYSHTLDLECSRPESVVTRSLKIVDDD